MSAVPAFWVTLGYRVVRWALAGLTFATAAAGTWLFVEALRERGFNPVEWLLVPLFLILFTWIAFSFWTATFGLLLVLWQRRPEVSDTAKPIAGLPGRSSRVAVLMPVYNESPVRVFAGLSAMLESLEATGQADQYDFFVLSDTTDPDIWLEEERMWGRLVSRRGDVRPRVFYRRRPRNICRKSGNLEDFCTRWGDHYDYMLVLDADSMMEGSTVVEMVRRMDADPELGILQAPPIPVNRLSPFARMQQLSAQLYGPIYVRGFAGWAQHDGNYWGHNAIIRVAPFMEHCGLPKLPGVPPLGGEILSHDFVEAALMARAGWRVDLAHDLGGSYEECPTTLLDFAKRDQRWCQGNMQHIRLVFCQNFRPLSRLHLLTGVMSYLSSPLWLLFMLLSLAAMLIEHSTGATLSQSTWFSRAAEVFALSMGMLLLPKLWALIALIGNPERRRQHGGWWGALRSVLLETAIAILIAPLMMLYHSRFVITTLLGKSVKWNAQNRDEGNTTLGEAVRDHWLHTLAGIGLMLLLVAFAPTLLVWFSPIVVGLVLSVPLAMFLGNADLGRALLKRGLLLIPEETSPPQLLKAHHRAIVANEVASAEVDRSKLFDSVLNDPVFQTMHRNILEATQSEVPLQPRMAAALIDVIDKKGPTAVSREERRAILSDADTLWELHLRLRSRGGLTTPRGNSAHRVNLHA